MKFDKIRQFFGGGTLCPLKPLRIPLKKPNSALNAKVRDFSESNENS